jgi:hypothetical protein
MYSVYIAYVFSLHPQANAAGETHSLVPDTVIIIIIVVGSTTLSWPPLKVASNRGFFWVS